MWEINTTQHYKIWLSKDRNQFLGMENQLRLVRFRETNPKAVTTFIYSSARLNPSAIRELKSFTSKLDIKTLDFDLEIPSLLEEKEDIALYEIAKKELTHPFGSEAAASDCVRILVPVMEKCGIYSDCDVRVNFKGVKKVKVQAPLIVQATTYTDGAPYLLADFIAASHHPNKPNKLSNEALEAIRKIQREIISRYQGSAFKAIMSHSLMGRNFITVHSNYSLFLQNYNIMHPNSDVFAFRKHLSLLPKAFSIPCMDPKTRKLTDYLFNIALVDKLKFNLNKASVVLFSGGEAFLTLFKEHIPKTGFNPFGEDGKKFMNIWLNHGLEKNGLSKHVNEGKKAYEQTQDASWNSFGLPKVLKREEAIFRAKEKCLSLYVKHHPQSQVSLRLKAKAKSQSALLQEIRPIYQADAPGINAMVTSICDKNYGQALRRVAASSHAKAESLVEILLKYRRELNIPVNEKAGAKDQAAIHLAANNMNPNIYTRIVEAGGDTELQDADKMSATEYRVRKK